MKLLLYCTKAKPYLYKDRYKDRGIEYALSNKKLVDNAFTRFNSVNGKIVAECDFEVEEIEPLFFYTIEDVFYTTKTLRYCDLVNKSCLSEQQLGDYLNKNKGYAIHIKNLNIFDEPKELSEFKQKGEYQCSKRKCPYFNTEKCHYASECLYEKIITKAPQNMMYCYDEFGNDYVLISIQPEGLCKILNKEKTIEPRKKILKEMLNDNR